MVIKATAAQHTDGFFSEIEDAVRARQLELLDNGCGVLLDRGAGEFSSLMRLLKAFSEGNDPIFRIERVTKKRWLIALTPLGNVALGLFKADWEFTERAYPYHQFSPAIRAFLRYWQVAGGEVLKASLEIYHSEELALFGLRRLRKRVNRNRDYLRSKFFKTVQENFTKSAKKNFLALKRSFVRVTTDRNFVISLRVDLFWDAQSRSLERNSYQEDFQILSDLKKATKKFQSYIRGKYGTKVLLTAFAIEYGELTKFHVHYWLVLENGAVDNPVDSAEQLGEKWRQLSGGGRGFYNCNANAKRYRFPAVNLIDLNDRNVGYGLVKICAYLTLAGVYAKLKIGCGGRTFQSMTHREEVVSVARRAKKMAGIEVLRGSLPERATPTNM